MIEQAGIEPGMRGLEIGFGGYNAALLAATGYGSRVRVLCADAEHRLPEEGVFDRILVTVRAWDIPPAWLEHLADDGVLVVPLRMNGVTRTLTFRRDAGHKGAVSTHHARPRTPRRPRRRPPNPPTLRSPPRRHPSRTQPATRRVATRQLRPPAA